MTGFLSICTKHEAFGLFHCFALSATLLCLVRYIFLDKYDFFMEESIDRRLAIAQSREKCYCQTSGNSTNSGKVLLPDVWQ